MTTALSLDLRQNFFDDSQLTKKGFISAELTLCIIVILILMYAAFVSFPEAKNNANRATAQQDLRTFKSAIVSYAGLANDSKPPANLGQLIADPSLSAEDAIDGVDHGPFLDKKKNWTTDSSSIKDPWGDAYQYNYDATTGTGTITSNGGGKAISITF